MIAKGHAVAGTRNARRGSGVGAGPVVRGRCTRQSHDAFDVSAGVSAGRVPYPGVWPGGANIRSRPSGAGGPHGAVRERSRRARRWSCSSPTVRSLRVVSGASVAPHGALLALPGDAKPASEGSTDRTFGHARLVHAGRGRHRAAALRRRIRVEDPDASSDARERFGPLRALGTCSGRPGELI